MPFFIHRSTVYSLPLGVPGTTQYGSSATRWHNASTGNKVPARKRRLGLSFVVATPWPMQVT